MELGKRLFGLPLNGYFFLRRIAFFFFEYLMRQLGRWCFIRCFLCGNIVTATMIWLMHFKNDSLSVAKQMFGERLRNAENCIGDSLEFRDRLLPGNPIRNSIVRMYRMSTLFSQFPPYGYCQRWIASSDVCRPDVCAGRSNEHSTKSVCILDYSNGIMQICQVATCPSPHVQLIKIRLHNIFAFDAK